MYLDQNNLLFYCNIADGDNNLNEINVINYNLNRRTGFSTYDAVVAETTLHEIDENVLVKTATM